MKAFLDSSFERVEEGEVNMMIKDARCFEKNLNSLSNYNIKKFGFKDIWKNHYQNIGSYRIGIIQIL